jgi:subtilisin-like proprotein convertase family protein
LVVSHNVGFGVPNAGYAVQMARTWSNRPPLVTLTMVDTQATSILDQGLRVEVTGSGIPASLASILSIPTQTPGLDEPTPALPLVDIGVAASVPAVNLTNKGALILRDVRPFVSKILNAAKAGAAFAIIYNSTNGGGFNIGSTDSGTYSSPIPTVFIGNTTGETLKAVFQTNGSALARFHLLSTDKTFHVTSTLLCEQVGVRIQSDHSSRGDLRITLRSPQGTRSVLQHINNDTNAGPADWTYWSTHHFFESSAGDWTVSISDELPGSIGSVLGVSLILRGTQITDADHDGLDDGWEITHFSTLSYGPKDDPDGDGLSNMREQLVGTNPTGSDLLKTPDLSRWGLFGSDMVRVSWPSAPLYSYKVFGGTNLSSLTLISNVPGTFPEAETFVPYISTQNGFFKVQAFQAP